MLQRSPDLAQPPQPTAVPSVGVGGDGSNVDRQLYKNLVEMLPLVESLVDRRVKSAYSRRATMVYTPAPPKSRKADLKNEMESPIDSPKKQIENTRKVDQESTSDDNGNVKKHKEEIVKLREQIENLQEKLVEKDEALRIAQSSIDELSSTYVTLNELRHRVGEKEALIQSTNSQLHTTKMLLAEKQAALEKLEWEVKACNSKINGLEESMGLMEFEISSLIKLFEKLCEDSSSGSEDHAIPSVQFDPVLIEMENEDVMNTERINQEMKAYAEALAAARDNPSDEFLVAAAKARTRFCSCMLSC